MSDQMPPQASSRSSARHTAGGETSEFLTFRLGAESYGIEIPKVQEILRIKFSLNDLRYDDFTVTIILYITGLAAMDDRMLILLDIEKLMTAADMALVEQVLH